MRPAEKLQLKAATILPLVELARSKQNPINRGHWAQYLYRPPPAGTTAYDTKLFNLYLSMGGWVGIGHCLVGGGDMETTSLFCHSESFCATVQVKQDILMRQ